jgi:hypothetical protein
MAGATATHRYSPKARGLLLVAILLAVVELVLLVPPLGSPD